MKTEKRLIDANALNWGRCPTDGKLAKAWLDEAPTVDAVEVVRCKDCIYAQKNYLVHGLCLCEKSMHHVIHGDRPKNALMCEDDFCSFGERKDNR